MLMRVRNKPQRLKKFSPDRILQKNITNISFGSPSMKSPYVYKTYSTPLNADHVRESLISTFLEYGYVQEESAENSLQFRYPSLRFTSKKPMTCISRIRFHLNSGPGTTEVVTGVTFTKIRFFTIAVMALICVVIPIIIGYYQHGRPDIPPMAVLGIPLGFLVHYQVRGRVFRTLRRMIEWME